MLYFSDQRVTIYQGDAREVLSTLAAGRVHCCVTSPPYFGLRSYLRNADPLKPAELGQEAVPYCWGWTHSNECGDCYVCKMVAVFREVKRVLRDDGTCWVNIGDSYNNTDKWGGGKTNAGKQTIAGNGDVPQFAVRAKSPKIEGVKPKDLLMIPAALALALRADGWYLRQDCIWAKAISFCDSYSGTTMPESVTDRFTKSHEHVFLLSKSPKYFFNQDAIKERQQPSSAERANYGWNGRTEDFSNGARTGSSLKKSGEKMQTIPEDGLRNPRSVWAINPAGFADAHFATFPEALPRIAILAGCPKGGTVLDPFCGSGTTMKVAEALGCNAVGIELNHEYLSLIRKRTAQPSLI